MRRIKSVDYAVPHLLVAAILYAVPHLLVVYTVLHREHRYWSICRATFVNRATFFVLYLLVCRATFVNRTTFTGYIY